MKTISELNKMPRCASPFVKEIAKQVVAEGSVLIKNDGVLPLAVGTKVSVFGRTQTNYNKSGTGSGGLVNTEKVKSIVDELKACKDLVVNDELLDVYQQWIKNNPYDLGDGWVEPWSQAEMPIDLDTVKRASQASDVAIVVVSRTAGEDKDNSVTQGSYLLSIEEEDLISKVSKCFNKVCVLLNVGNVIDCNFIEKYNVGSALYLWQGGQYGAEVVCDLLTGKVNPSGKLTDTIAKSVTSYPSNETFGQFDKAIYQEDIYVGYRYFETFAKDEVAYPFGYGLSYTTFDMVCTKAQLVGDNVTLDISVTNTGNVAGKQVVQAYYRAPMGKLGQPLAQLVAFCKTPSIKPQDTANVTITFAVTDMKSYDDLGVTGNKSCFVLEQGNFDVLVGDNARDLTKVFTYENKSLTVVEQLSQAMSPSQSFYRLKPTLTKDGVAKEMELVVAGATNQKQSVASNLPQDIAQTGDVGIKLYDVYCGNATMQQFVAQLNAEQLITLAQGEGMSSPKVTAGTATAFGGTSQDLQHFGIPVACATDGPSGLRLDGGDKATCIPNGTLLACTFNTQLIEQLFSALAVELYVYDIDLLLGPGINVHRHPLNGRNFEYFSEDPYLTGAMSVAIAKGLSVYGSGATIKHLCCNSQEYNRNGVDAIVSERALREIYLKGFEIAVKSGFVKAIMTSYNPVNGIYTAGNYDLNTTILREQWGYKGMVMTDWWAQVNELGNPGTRTNLHTMISAQNDVYMVVTDALNNPLQQDAVNALNDGQITLGQLQRNAINVLNLIVNSLCFKKFVQNGCKFNHDDNVTLTNEQPLFTFENVSINQSCPLKVQQSATYYFKVTYRCAQVSVAQRKVTLYIADKNSATDTISTVNGQVESVMKVNLINLGDTTFKLTGDDSLSISKVQVYKK